MSDEAARFLAASPDRFRLLVHLRGNPGSPRAIADTLDVAHRSVQRNLTQLVDRGWVEKRDGAYRLTTTGTLVTAEHESYVEALDTIEELAPLYRHLPDAEHAPDPSWLGDATVVVAASDRPQAPVNHYLTAVEALDTDHIRMISPVLSRLFHEAHAQLALAGVDHDLVMSVETATRARDLNPAEFETVVGVDPLSLFCHPGPVGFGLTIGGGRAILSAYDDEGQLHALVDGSDVAYLDWATALFERYRDASDRIDAAADLDER